MLTLREGVEFFHIAFLGELGVKLDKARYALKGGCNLRFFYNSPRYSEDLDVDVGTVSVGTLKGNLSKVLEGKALRTTLRASGIEILSISLPKQTETTQRWKLGLRIGTLSAHTKVEFSRRDLESGRRLDPIAPAIVAGYGLTPVLVSHYDRATALAQKCHALVGRSETQARDVFDLDLLLAGAQLSSSLSAEIAEAAAERALSLDFGAFRSQVVAYLPATQQPAYSTPEVWTDMQLRVASAVRGSS